MHFCLSITLANLQDYINLIIVENLDNLIIIYIDNILIYTNKTDYIASIW